MTEYKPLNSEPCAAVRWLVSECLLNKTAAMCGFDALMSAMPKAHFFGMNADEVELFKEVYEDELMRAVITGYAPDGLKVDNPGFWPTYRQQRDQGNIISNAEPWYDESA